MSIADHLLESLKLALEFDEGSPDGAVVFLNGPWGSGKTYYWKKFVQPALPKNKCLYVSLFGVRNISDLKSKLIAAMLAGGQEEGVLAKGRALLSRINPSALIGKFTGIQLNCDVLELIPFRYVVCFDDLERLPKEAAIDEILGFINYLSEHKSYRCLIILNESEMKEVHKAEYVRLREKLSLRTFQLPFDLEERFDGFISAKARTNGVELQAGEIMRIKSALMATNTDNLRTVRFFLDCYFQLREGLSAELPPDVLKFLVAIVDTEARGKVNGWEFYSFNPMEIYFRELSKEKDGAKDQPPDLRSEFYFKYFGENAPYRAYRCVFDVVKQGHFDLNGAKLEVFPTEASLSEPERLAKKIADTHFFFCEDEELKALIDKINRSLKEDRDLQFGTIFSYVKGLSAAIKLLELPEPTTLPDGFTTAATAAAKRVEDPAKLSHDFEYRSSEFVKLYIDELKRICSTELATRRHEEFEKALRDGNTQDLSTKLLESQAFLEQVHSGGQIEKIWKSTTLRNEGVSRLLEALIQKMVLYSSHSDKVRGELDATHNYLTARYNETKDKMGRLRIYRLLEKTGRTLPADVPAAAKRP